MRIAHRVGECLGVEILRKGTRAERLPAEIHGVRPRRHGGVQRLGRAGRREQFGQFAFSSHKVSFRRVCPSVRRIFGFIAGLPQTVFFFARQ